MARKLIGIIGNSFQMDDNYFIQGTGLHNIEAVQNLTGAICAIIPALPSVSPAEELLAHYSGFVFTGARPNIHPEEYGRAETPSHAPFDRDRDAVTLPLIRAAVKKGVPILCICRGFQELNVAFGGTLHPEIRDLPGISNHRMPPDGTIEEKFALRHDVTIAENSPFINLFGSNVVRTNTLHGQGIDSAGERILIEGRAPDGTPELIRVENAKSFAVGVQWHPEYNADQDPVSVKLFQAFGKAVNKA